jgi:parallel beta-helix repeat protein
LFYWSNNNTIKNNICYDNSYGISFSYTSNENKISNNICSYNNNIGILIEHSDRLVISNNSFDYNSDTGLWLFDSQYNIIEYNNFINNYDYGIYFRAYSYGRLISYNIIKFNTITDNDYGIYLDDYAYYNYIYCNNFFSNDYYQARDYGYYNQWSNAYNEGNYWSDYTGVDNGASGRIEGDGIGDTDLPHYGLDYYPFTQQSGWLSPGIAYIFEPQDCNLDSEYTIYWLRCRCAINYILIEDTNKDFGNPTPVYEGADLSYKFEPKAEGTYYYRLNAFFNDSESDWSNIVNITIYGPPKKPKNVQVAPYLGGNALMITWLPNTGKIKEYQLECKTTGDWKLVDYITHPIVEYNHTNLIDGATYSYRVKAKDVWGQVSDYSAVAEGVPKDLIAPAAPRNSRLIVLDYDSIKIRWDNNLYDEDLVGYNIYRTSAENSTSWGNPINGEIPVNDNTYIDTGLDELTTYFYVVTAVDEVPNESGYTKIVSDSTTLGPHAPEVKSHPTEIVFDEDVIDTSIDLYKWFEDVNGDKLKFHSEGGVFINIVISQQTGIVRIEPVLGWNGQEVITFYANDSNHEVSTEVTIKIKSINDPPGKVHILEPAEGSYYKETETINFIGQCEDPDIPYGDFLTFKWSSDMDGVLGIGKNLTDIKLSIGTHMITLEVSDSAQSTSEVSINIMITEEIKDSKKDRDDGSLFGLNYIFLIIIIIIIVIILLSVYYVIRRGQAGQHERYIEEPVDVDESEFADEQYPDEYDTYEEQVGYQGHQEQQQFYQDYESYPNYPQEQARWDDDGYENDQRLHSNENETYYPDEIPPEDLNVDWMMKQENVNEAEFTISELIEE